MSPIGSSHDFPVDFNDYQNTPEPQGADRAQAGSSTADADRFAHLLEAYQRNPKDSNLLVDIGRMLNPDEKVNLPRFKQGFDRKACFVHALELNKNNVLALLYLGGCLGPKEKVRLGLSRYDAKELYAKAFAKKEQLANSLSDIAERLQPGEKISIPGLGSRVDKEICSSLHKLTLNSTDAQAFLNLSIALKPGILVNIPGVGNSLGKEVCMNLYKLMLNPSDAAAFCNLGKALIPRQEVDIPGMSMAFDKKEFDRKACYLKALKIDPTFVPAFYNLGMLIGNIGSKVDIPGEEKRFGKKACMVKVLEFQPTNIDALYNLSQALRPFQEVSIPNVGYHGLNKQKCLLKVLELHPTFSNAFRDLGNILQPGETIKIQGTSYTKEMLFQKAEELKLRKAKLLADAKNIQDKKQDAPIVVNESDPEFEDENQAIFSTPPSSPLATQAEVSVLRQEISQIHANDQRKNAFNALFEDFTPNDLKKALVKYKLSEADNTQLDRFVQRDSGLKMNPAQVKEMLKMLSFISALSRSEEIAELLVPKYSPPAGMVKDYFTAFTVGMQRQYSTAQIITSGQFTQKESLLMNAGSKIASSVLKPLAAAGIVIAPPVAAAPAVASGMLALVAHGQEVHKHNMFERFLSAFESQEQFNRIAAGVVQDLCMRMESELSTGEQLANTQKDPNQSNWAKKTALSFDILSVKHVPTQYEPGTNKAIAAMVKWAEKMNMSKKVLLLDEPIKRKAMWDVARLFNAINKMSEEEMDSLKQSSNPTAAWRTWLGQQLVEGLETLEIVRTDGAVAHMENPLAVSAGSVAERSSRERELINLCGQLDSVKRNSNRLSLMVGNAVGSSSRPPVDLQQFQTVAAQVEELQKQMNLFRKNASQDLPADSYEVDVHGAEGASQLQAQVRERVSARDARQAGTNSNLSLAGIQRELDELKYHLALVSSMQAQSDERIDAVSKEQQEWERTVASRLVGSRSRTLVKAPPQLPSTVSLEKFQELERKNAEQEQQIAAQKKKSDQMEAMLMKLMQQQGASGNASGA